MALSPRILARFLLVLAAAPWSPQAAAQSSPAVGALLAEPPGEFLRPERAFPLSLHIPQAHQLQLHWDVAPGYYLYRSQLGVEIYQAGAWLPLELRLPPGEWREDEFLGRQQVFPLPVSGEARYPGEGGRLRVRFQGCAEQGLCYAPQRQEFRLDHAALVASPVGGLEFPSRPSADGAALPAMPGGVLRPGGFFPAWLVALLLALLGGLLLNLMPCVLPVLSLKVMHLLSLEARGAPRLLHGVVYSIGVVLSCVLLAALLLFLRSAGNAIGWGFQLQNPIMTIFLVYLFFVLGLYFSGWLEVSGRYAGVGQGWAQGDGLSASFFSGLLAVVVASPCTAPFMAAAVGFAVVQPPFLGLLIFAVLGLGLALPFLLLSAVPGALAFLPKPGAWMQTLRHVLAFPLYASALWLLWVVGRQIGVDGLILVAGGCLALFGGVWLWRHSAARRPGWLPRGMAAALFLFALLLPSLGLQRAGAPAEEYWIPYDAATLSRLSARQPLFLKVTAAWCLPCISNEHLALRRDVVRQAFRSYDVALMEADWTRQDAAVAALLARYGRAGVPLYLLFVPGAREVVPLPQILSPDLVLGALTAALGPRE